VLLMQGPFGSARYIIRCTISGKPSLSWRRPDAKERLLDSNQHRQCLLKSIFATIRLAVIRNL
jgi:hypothetical protein